MKYSQHHETHRNKLVLDNVDMTASGTYMCQVAVGKIFKRKSSARCDIEISELVGNCLSFWYFYQLFFFLEKPSVFWWLFGWRSFNTTWIKYLKKALYWASVKYRNVKKIYFWFGYMKNIDWMLVTNVSFFIYKHQ